MPYARISANLKRAVIVTEDSAFWQHEGVDYEQLRESMEVNWERGEFARGASTITQQLAKNLYLSPSKNPMRKLRELLITRRLEVELPKQRILEIYLNVIEWGDGVWGAEAAARRYFRKSAAELNATESALLAGAIANPHIMNPGQPTATAAAPAADDHAADGGGHAAAGRSPNPPAPAPAAVPAIRRPISAALRPAVLPGTPVAAPKAPGKPGGRLRGEGPGQ